MSLSGTIGGDDASGGVSMGGSGGTEEQEGESI